MATPRVQARDDGDSVQSTKYEGDEKQLDSGYFLGQANNLGCGIVVIWKTHLQGWSCHPLRRKWLLDEQWVERARVPFELPNK